MHASALHQIARLSRCFGLLPGKDESSGLCPAIEELSSNNQSLLKLIHLDTQWLDLETLLAVELLGGDHAVAAAELKTLATWHINTPRDRAILPGAYYLAK
jgi:hypothetical protein